MLKTSSRHVFKTSSRRLEDQQMFAGSISFSRPLLSFWTITAQKWSFPLSISSVNVTKSAGNSGFGHIHHGVTNSMHLLKKYFIFCEVHVVYVNSLNQVCGIWTILSAFFTQIKSDYKRQHGLNQQVHFRMNTPYNIFCNFIETSCRLLPIPWKEQQQVCCSQYS